MVIANRTDLQAATQSTPRVVIGHAKSRFRLWWTGMRVTTVEYVIRLHTASYDNDFPVHLIMVRADRSDSMQKMHRSKTWVCLLDLLTPLSRYVDM